MRLFIAVWPADNIKKELIRFMHDLKTQGTGGNYIPAQNLHMTLAFLGEVKNPDPVKEAMAAVPAEHFRLSLTDCGYKGDLLYVGVKGNQKIKKYVSDLKMALDQRGIACDKSKFEPHITVIRGLKGKRPAKPAAAPEEMTVKKISLVKSEEKDGKRIYKEIYSVTV